MSNTLEKPFSGIDRHLAVFTVFMQLFAVLGGCDINDDTLADSDGKYTTPLQVGVFNAAGKSAFSVSFGNDDAAEVDVYLRFGDTPTLDRYDCVLLRGASGNTCSVSVPTDSSSAHLAVVGDPDVKFDISVAYLAIDGAERVQESINGIVPHETEYGAATVTKSIGDKLSNGSFESFDSNIKPNSWARYHAGSTYGGAQSGSYKVHFTTSSGYVYQTFSLSSNDAYYTDLYFKGTIGPTIKAHYSNGGYDFKSCTGGSASSWTYCSLSSFDSNTTINKLTIEANQHGSEVDNVHFYYNTGGGPM